MSKQEARKQESLSGIFASVFCIAFFVAEFFGCFRTIGCFLLCRRLLLVCSGTDGVTHTTRQGSVTGNHCYAWYCCFVCFLPCNCGADVCSFRFVFICCLLQVCCWRHSRRRVRLPEQLLRFDGDLACKGGLRGGTGTHRRVFVCLCAICVFVLAVLSACFLLFACVSLSACLRV